MSSHCFQILTEQVCTQVVHKPHPEPDSTVKIQNPSKRVMCYIEFYSFQSALFSGEIDTVCMCLCLCAVILKVVATSLKNSAPSTELMEVRRLFLSDMIKLFSNSRENRR